MLITINIRQKDIDHGVSRDCKTCPVGKAVNELLNSEYEARIFETYIEIYNVENLNHPVLKTMDYSFEVGTFIRKFDLDKQVQPLKFDIDLPAKYLKV